MDRKAVLAVVACLVLGIGLGLAWHLLRSEDPRELDGVWLRKVGSSYDYADPRTAPDGPPINWLRLEATGANWWDDNLVGKVPVTPPDDLSVTYEVRWSWLNRLLDRLGVARLSPRGMFFSLSLPDDTMPGGWVKFRGLPHQGRQEGARDRLRHLPGRSRSSAQSAVPGIAGVRDVNVSPAEKGV